MARQVAMMNKFTRSACSKSNFACLFANLPLFSGGDNFFFGRGDYFRDIDFGNALLLF